MRAGRTGHCGDVVPQVTQSVLWRKELYSLRPATELEARDLRHRDLQPGEGELREEEQNLLDRVCEAYYLPAWCSLHDYRRLFKEQGMQVGLCCPQ